MAIGYLTVQIADRKTSIFLNIIRKCSRLKLMLILKNNEKYLDDKHKIFKKTYKLSDGSFGANILVEVEKNFTEKHFKPPVDEQVRI
jgi:hypothetical protein